MVQDLSNRARHPVRPIGDRFHQCPLGLGHASSSSSSRASSRYPRVHIPSSQVIYLVVSSFSSPSPSCFCRRRVWCLFPLFPCFPSRWSPLTRYTFLSRLLSTAWFALLQLLSLYVLCTSDILTSLVYPSSSHYGSVFPASSLRIPLPDVWLLSYFLHTWTRHPHFPRL
ncbi:hypothetical protein FIBSPDRAFT_33557 [Athelia psychrophila]|uniref:Uncharacterized protein n=1 Tax=Athelia psychrophila TaxID=1759441 RepID=A0A166FU44_9AGAM|nr:hypothetical protein FIBSPDRAFT_33557 [Fibularhizoctonia sp. CBS 109695]